MLLKSGALLGLFVLLGNSAYALRQCAASHCSGADAEINEICRQEGWPIGHPVLTRDASGPCTCTCSCLALGTPVAASLSTFRSIEDFAVGDEVLAAGPDLKWHPVKVAFSQGTTGNARQPFSVFLEYGDRALIVTADHLFLMSDGKLKRADRLSLQDKLALASGGSVKVASIQIGDYYGGFHHIATSTTPPAGNLADHLLNTNGVVSADYAVQLFQTFTDQPMPFIDSGMFSLPIVGTPEYSAKYGSALKEEVVSQDILSIAGLEDRLSAVAAKPSKGKFEGVFVPAERAGIEIPAHAHPFLPEDQAKILEAAPKRAFTDPLAQQWTEYLVTYYRAFYPGVIYHVDWYNNAVNAYAWVENGVRHVALLGGLIRASAVELEGLGLVLAHELAHHYGGPPTYPGGLSCEGQADFFGARNVMRRIWFGEFYLTTMTKAIVQLGNLFGFLPPTGAVAAAGCNHPPGVCRVQTYNFAVDLRPKPACAQ